MKDFNIIYKEAYKIFKDHYIVSLLSSYLNNLEIFDNYNYEYGNLVKRDKFKILKKIDQIKNNLKDSKFYTIRDISILSELKDNFILENHQSAFFCILRISEMLCNNLIMNYILRNSKIIGDERDAKYEYHIEKEDVIFYKNNTEGGIKLNILKLLKEGKTNFNDYILYFKTSNFKNHSQISRNKINIWLLFLEIINQLRNTYIFHFNYYEHPYFQDENLSNVKLLCKKFFTNKLVNVTKKLCNIRKDDECIKYFYDRISSDKKLQIIAFTTPTHIFNWYNEISEYIFIFCISYIYYMSEFTKEL